MVTKFLEDTVVDDEIELANTKHNFFSQNMYGMMECLRVIDKKIRQEEEEILALKKLTGNLL